MIKNKAISSISMAQNGTLLGKVDVTVQNPQTGEEFVYEAPMTFGRQGGADPVDMTFQQLADAAGGFFQYANAMAPFKELLGEVNQRLYDGRNGEGAFEEKTNLLMAEYTRNNTDYEAESPVKGMSVGDFIANPLEMKRYFQAAVLDPDMLDEKPESIADANYNLMARSNPITTFETSIGRKLTRAQVLQAALYLDVDANGRVDVDPKLRNQWNDFKNRIAGRKTKNRRNR